MLKHWILEHKLLVQADCTAPAFKRETYAAVKFKNLACKLTRNAVAAEERSGALSSGICASLACVHGCMAVAILLYPGLLERPAKVLLSFKSLWQRGLCIAQPLAQDILPAPCIDCFPEVFTGCAT